MTILDKIYNDKYDIIYLSKCGFCGYPILIIIDKFNHHRRFKCENCGLCYRE